MHRFTVMLCGLLLAGLMSACAPIAAPTPDPTGATPIATPATGVPSEEPVAEPTAEPVEEPVDDDADMDPDAQPADADGPLAVVAQGVRDFLAAEFGVESDDIEILQMEAVDWPDGCLGAPADDEMCMMVITPGYRVTTLVDGEEVVVHTNADGSVVRLSPNGEVRTAGNEEMSEQISMTIRQMLMQQLHADADQVVIASVEATEFSDACLGVSNPAELCAQMITPGYRVILEVDGQEYIYHTDATGQNVRLASAPEARTGDVVIHWTGDNGECREATIGLEGVAFGRCYDRPMQGFLAGEQRSNELAEFAATYASFDAETPAGFIEFTGNGEREAGVEEQRMIAEWAQVVALEAEAGRSGASWGLTFAWYREGGIAGFCDTLSTYITGDVTAAQCEGEEYTTLGQRRLDSNELAQIYSWIDEYAPFEMEQTDPATADAMTIRLVFSGGGETEADDAAQQEIAEYASDLFNTFQP